MATTVKKPRKPRVTWSQEDFLILEEIVMKSKTKSGVAMVKLLENKTPKNNQKLCMQAFNLHTGILYPLGNRVKVTTVEQ